MNQSAIAKRVRVGRFAVNGIAFSVRSGQGDQIEMGYRDDDYQYYLDTCISSLGWCWRHEKIFQPRSGPAFDEVMWLGLSIESENTFKGYVNGVEFGTYGDAPLDGLDSYIFFHKPGLNTANVLQIALFANDASTIFRQVEFRYRERKRR
ncbi:hypothetical protein MTO96_030745 [Rhipicephalus appendiculatus]